MFLCAIIQRRFRNIILIKQPLFLSIGLRYSGALGSSGFASFVSVMSIIGVFLGVAALIVVSSVMNGLENTMKYRTMAVVSHAIVSNGTKNSLSHEDEALQEQLKGLPGVISVAPVVESEAIIQSNSQLSALQITGVDVDSYPPEDLLRQSTSYESNQDRLPYLKQNPYGIILGSRLAQQLDVIPGDQVRVMFPRGARYTMAGKMPSERLFKVMAVFKIGSDVDATSAIINLNAARKVMRLGQGFDGYRIWLEDPFLIDEFEAALPSGVTVRDWRSEKGELFQAIAMEKKMMALMLFLIVFVAAFNILSSLIMMVMDKSGEIAILRTMGFKSSRVMLMFMSQGMICGVIGTVLGALCGTVVALYLNEILGFIGLSEQFLYGAPLPVLINPYMLALIVFASIGLCVLSTLYPSYKASQVMPAEVLRYE